MKTTVIRCSNSTVTDFYLNIIDEACKRIDSGNNVTITARNRDCLKAKMRGEITILWSQGIAPEEFAMRYNNPFKLLAVDFMAKEALKRADFVLFVSDYMREHYEKKYKLKFDPKRYYIMPCFNTVIHEEAFYEPNKYEHNVFTYIGSMEAWQGVDHTIATYKIIEEMGLPNTSLEIYTGEQDIAREKVRRAGLKNFKIDFCPNEELPTVLKRIKYGFILRDNNEVNRVSTPTKISTYMSNGVIPIYSDCLTSFHSIAKNLRYVVEEKELFQRIEQLNTIESHKLFMEYEKVFNKYYSKEYHLEALTGVLNSISN